MGTHRSGRCLGHVQASLLVARPRQEEATPKRFDPVSLSSFTTLLKIIHSSLYPYVPFCTVPSVCVLSVYLVVVLFEKKCISFPIASCDITN